MMLSDAADEDDGDNDDDHLGKSDTGQGARGTSSLCIGFEWVHANEAAVRPDHDCQYDDHDYHDDHDERDEHDNHDIDCKND